MRKRMVRLVLVCFLLLALSACEIQTTPPHTAPESTTIKEPDVTSDIPTTNPDVTTSQTEITETTAGATEQPIEILPYPGFSIQARTYDAGYSNTPKLISEFRFTESGGIEEQSYDPNSKRRDTIRYNEYGDRVYYLRKESNKTVEETIYTHTYDADGKPLTRTLYDVIDDTTSRYEYEYNEAGQLIRSEEWTPGTRYEHVLGKYIYDNTGRLLQIISDDFVDDLGTYTLYYTYDENGRLIEKTLNHSQAIWRYSYYENGTQKSYEYIQNYISPEHTLTEYNPDGTPARKYGAWSQPDYFEDLYEYTYEITENGKVERTARYSLNENGAKTLSNVYEKEYDADGRLVREELTRGEDPWTTATHKLYTYDFFGNLIKLEKYDAQGRHLSTETHTYQYDQYGRILQKDKLRYEYEDCTAEQYALYEKLNQRSYDTFYSDNLITTSAPEKSEDPDDSPSTPQDPDQSPYAPTLLDGGYLVPKDGKPIIQYENGIAYINGVLIANKTYALPEDYNPNGLHPDAKAAFEQMKEAAAAEGISLKIVSGYRSYSLQSKTYNNYVSRDGQDLADRYSARPGHSEHQSGLAMDINACENWFADSPEGIWLAAHCAEYGFIIRYPKDKEAETGYMYEPWHIRYLGTELAAAVTQSGLCLEEYLDITSSYDAAGKTSEILYDQSAWIQRYTYYENETVRLHENIYDSFPSFRHTLTVYNSVTGSILRNSMRIHMNQRIIASLSA